MTALSPLCIPAVLGYFTLVILLRNTPLRWKGLFLLAASIPTGFGLCSLILFFSLCVIPSQAMAVSITSGLAVTLLGGGLLLWRHSKDSPGTGAPLPRVNLEQLRKNLSAHIPKDKKAALKTVVLAFSFLIFLITLWNVIQFFLASASTNITGGWDARYMWSTKAKFMFRFPEAWQGMFSPLISWSHNDYPLLWPGTLAWGWNWMGQESLLWPPWASLGFYISCGMILVWYLGTQVSPLAGWWGGTFFFALIPPLFWSIHLYTDLPLAFFMAASTLLLLVGLRSGHARLFLISGLMAGLASWTKNEGLQFLIVAGLLLGSLKILEKRSGTPGVPVPLSPFLWGCLLPLIAVLTLKIFLGKTGEYLGSGRSIGESLAMIFSGRSDAPAISRSFAVHGMNFASWKGLWFFFAAACAAWCFKKSGGKYSGIFPVLIILLNAGYTLAFLISPADLTWHLETALQRLLIHTAPLALAFSFELLTCRPGALPDPQTKNGQAAKAARPS